jgi:hypothetical protein
LASPDIAGHTADFVILRHEDKRAFVVEVKDGDTFDTKKSSGELANLQAVCEFIQHRTGYATTFHLCAFNQTSRAAIVLGLKRRFTEDQVMTGRELCDLIGADYDSIVGIRRSLQEDNLEYLVTQMIQIPEVKQWLETKLLWR